MKKKELVLVCGYGCVLKKEHEEYLKRVAQHVNNKVVEKVIVCGGPTQQRSARGFTEAGAMKEFLKHFVSVPIVEEDASFTTFANLRNARAMLPYQFPSYRPVITVFCDAIRALKVKLIAEKVFRGYAVRIETFDLGAGSAKKQLISTCGEALLLFFPLVLRAKEWVARLRAKTR